MYPIHRFDALSAGQLSKFVSNRKCALGGIASERRAWQKGGILRLVPDELAAKCQPLSSEVAMVLMHSMYCLRAGTKRKLT
jgi:hypothetical protein